MSSRPNDIRLPPDVFAAVMATGIVSIAAEDHHYRLISDALAALGAVGFAMLVVLAVVARPRWDFRDPDVVLRLFTFVAACAVLASRFKAHPSVLWTLSGVAVVAWLALAPVAAVDMCSRRWRELRDEAHGGWELASVATSGIAIVGADLTVVTRHDALLAVSVVMWILAVMVYALVTSLILWRAVAGTAFAPDHWILMGGLAISTLAGDRLHAAAVAVDSSLAHGGQAVTVVTWLLATAWIPVLLVTHLVHIRGRPGSLRFAGVWWAAVFPLGMYAAATAATAREMHWAALTAVSLVFCWVALAVWLLVALGGVARLTRFATQ